MNEDRFGYTLTTDSSQATQAYVSALDDLFCMRSEARSTIDQAIGADPDFALAHCVDARIKLIEGDTRAGVEAANLAERLAAKATPREQSHARLVGLVTRNETEHALEMVQAHMQEYPRDALPLSFALGVYSLLGFGGFVDHHQRQVALLQALAPAWPEDWWFLTWMGRSMVEVGDCSRGIEMLDRALDLKPENANAAHGRAHGYYETGEIQAGAEFLERWLPTYQRHQPLHCHLAWHWALGRLHAGDKQGAVAVYNDMIRPQRSHALPMFTMIDCAAFAWRAGLAGVKISAELRAEIAAFVSQHFPKPTVPFVNYHLMLTHQMTDPAQADAFLTALRGSSDDHSLSAHSISTRLCEAIHDLGRGEVDQAIAVLETLQTDWAMLGGSNAQRDLLFDTLIGASIAAGHSDKATHLAREREAKRAHHLDDAWLARQRGLTGLVPA